MPTILRNNAFSIEVDRSANFKYTVNKGDFDVIMEDAGHGISIVYMILRSSGITKNYLELDWRDICDPIFTSATELRDTLLEWNVKQARTTVVTKKDSSATNVTLLAANESRKMATIYNNSTAHLYIKYGVTASLNSFTLRISPEDYLELPAPCYLGRIDGFWESVNGNAMVTEIE